MRRTSSSNGLPSNPFSSTLAMYITGFAVMRCSSRSRARSSALRPSARTGRASLSRRAHAPQQFDEDLRVLVARVGSAPTPVEYAFDGLEIREREFGVDHFDVVARRDPVGYVHDVVVDETPYDVRHRIGLADVCEKLIAEAFAFRCARDQTGDVDEFHRCRNDFLWLDDSRYAIEPRVRHRHDAGVRFDRAEREVLGRDRGLRQRIEQRRLADVR